MGVSTGLCAHRNERYQEELWRKSIEMVKDFLSASTLATYGESQPLPAHIEAPVSTHTKAEVRQGWQ